MSQTARKPPDYFCYFCYFCRGRGAGCPMMAPTHPDPIPQPGETLDAFIERTDPSLSSWTERVESSEDIRLAIAYGALTAVFDIAQISCDYDHAVDVKRTLVEFLAGCGRLRKQRDSVRLVKALARERAVNAEARERRSEEEKRDEP